jgi:hypothetical protein
LFLQERRKLRIYGNITWGIGVLLLWNYDSKNIEDNIEFNIS